MEKIFLICIFWHFISISCIAVAPSTVGGVVASAGKISNTLKESTAWKKLTAHPNALARMFPSRAMEVVQEVVGSFRRESPIIIETPQGQLRGKIQRYKSGHPGSYFSFRGIRYGAPPVGLNRFRAAKPEEPWTDIRDALKEGNTCPHRNVLLGTYKGDEDCLFLNVFTPQLADGYRNPKLPVMVWLHGGGYSFGSGNSFIYGPDDLVGEDVVLVTINYRLGPLGFLSVCPDAPGNSGLKDQVLALKWVQQNIKAFGGNPNEVTIFGESAGASSVQYLMLSPMGKGLFRRGISQSGSVFNPWASISDASERAFRLGSALGLDTNNTEELLTFLRNASARSLIDSALETLTPEDIRKNIGLPFVPTIEGKWNGPKIFLEEPFLTKEPRDIYNEGNFIKVPYITGFNTHEAMLFLRRLRSNPALLEIFNTDFVRLVPLNLNMTGGPYSLEAKHLARDIREFYLNSRNITLDTIEEMIFLLTDLMFFRGIIDTARYHATKSTAPVYVYRFAFDGSLGLYKRLMAISRPGVCHGDELGYIFHFGFFNLVLDPTSSELLVKRRMVRIWTNFAKYGKPTPVADPLLGADWEPVEPTQEAKNIKYLDISLRLETKTNPEPERLAFWDNMYKHYNGGLL